MKTSDIFKSAIEFGIANDPRGTEEIEKILGERQKGFDDLKDKDKEYFDVETLANPYADSKVLFNTEDEKDIKTVLVGVDIEGPELLLAKDLKVDLAIAHHPEGLGYANLSDVMGMQADIHNKLGVPISTASSLISSRMGEVRRSIMGANHSRAVDFARILEIPFMCLHTPADNLVNTKVQTDIDVKKPETLSDIIDILLEYPEYKTGKKNGEGPNILVGSGSNKPGKVFVDMTGGTSGNKKIYERLSIAGVDTIVGMHMGDAHKKEVEKYGMNVIIAGHYSSDSVGISLLLNQILSDDIKVINCSGYIR